MGRLALLLVLWCGVSMGFPTAEESVKLGESTGNPLGEAHKFLDKTKADAQQVADQANIAPANAPTDAPTDAPANAPTDAPTDAPSNAPLAHEYVPKGHTFANKQARSGVDEKAYCRCVSEDNTKGLSICMSGGPCAPTKVCEAEVFGCASSERKCDTAKCTCKPNEKQGEEANQMTFEDCEKQCEALEMIIPKDADGIEAAKNTGCGSNGKKVWVHTVTGAPTPAPTKAPTDEPTQAPTNAPTDAPFWMAKFVTKGVKYDPQPRVEPEDKKWCRCVKDDNSKGLSICTSAPDTCTSAGCGDNAKCKCKPDPSKGEEANEMSFEDCQKQCEAMTMVIPKDQAGLDAAKNSGCGTNNKEMWVRPTHAPKFVEKGVTYDNPQSPAEPDDKKWCRCIKDDNSKGLSICTSAPDTCTSAGCGDNAKCKCKPDPSKGEEANEMSFEDCQKQCEAMTMVIPKDQAGLDAAKNSGCGTNNKAIWVTEE